MQTRKQDAPVGPSLKLDTDDVINDLTGKMSSFESGVPRVWRSFPGIGKNAVFDTSCDRFTASAAIKQ